MLTFCNINGLRALLFLPKPFDRLGEVENQVSMVDYLCRLASNRSDLVFQDCRPRDELKARHFFCFGTCQGFYYLPLFGLEDSVLVFPEYFKSLEVY